MSVRHVLELKSLLEDRGGDGFVEFVEESVTPDTNGIAEMRPEDWSFKAMWEAFDLAESVDSTAFPKATGALINKKVIDGYETSDTIGEQLVTIIPSTLRQETIVGFDSLEVPEEVPEGIPYPDSSLGEKYVTITNTKFGRIISITEETVTHDQTGQILVRANNLGERAGLHRDKKIVQGVSEIDTVYYPSGSSSTLYANTSTPDDIDNLMTTALGQDGMAEAEQMLYDMTDSEGEPINPPRPWLLLIPSDLKYKADMLYNAEYNPDGVDTDGLNEPNIYRGQYEPMVSPYLTDSSDWWLGNFKKQFVWTEVYPIETAYLPTGGEEGFSRDIKAKFKVRYYGGVGAVDNKYVIKSD